MRLQCICLCRVYGQPLKEEGGFSAVLCDGSGASPDLLHQFYGLVTP